MAKLFKNKIIGQKLETFQIDNFEEKLEVVKKWHKDYHTGSLKQDKEISRAPGWTQDFLGEVLGYIRKPSENHTYDTEYSIVGQRPDFVLAHFGSTTKGYVIGELKDAKTSLDAPQKREGSVTPVQQAFKYKGNLRDSSFVIVSNFFETRLYYDNYLDYEMWTLDTLIDPKNDYFELRKFIFLLTASNLIAKRGESMTKSLISFIQSDQKEITKKFYKEYSLLRKELFKDIIVQAKKAGKTYKQSELDMILSKTQKIIDRIIFIHFCEDLDLLPQGKLKENLLRAEEIGFSPWEMLKKFFEFVNSGSERLGIPNGYNGGLFHKDVELEALEIGDEICKKFVDLGAYDFKDDLSVNILGHIFEQSISDIEELKDKIQKNEEVALSKRKKDGVFYTPEYIVDYIVKNSVGKKIEDWEQELREKHNLKEDINDKNYNKRAILVYSELQEKLQNITVLDPACGSGAFLVNVFDFLLAKNQEISKTLEDLGVNQGLFSTESHFKSILQKNIYGVDLNEESVEITKLSLWLKTAIKGRKLANLDSNIKCGNSLIDDKEIAGNKAFSWETEFPQIFSNGGFDVIVGNPPYARVMDKEQYSFFSDTYKTPSNRIDYYGLFFELSINIIKGNGYIGFITPNTYLLNLQYQLLRNLIIDFGILNITDFRYQVFEQANVDTLAIILAKNNLDIPVYRFSNMLDVGTNKDIFTTVTQDELSIESPEINIDANFKQKDIFHKIVNNRDTVTLSDICKIRNGINPGMPESRTHLLINSANEGVNPVKRLDGRDISRYLIEWDNNWFDYDKNYKVVGGSLRDENLFLEPKILIQDIRNLSLKRRIVAVYDDEQYYNLYTLHNIVSLNLEYDLKYILSILNSTLINEYFRLNFKDIHIKPRYLSKLPIKNIPLSEQTPFIEKTDFMLENNKLMGEKVQKFLKRVQGTFELEKLSKKLLAFYELSFEEFVKELKKVKVVLSLKDQDEWEEYFDSYKSEIVELKTKIDACDREIDEMVFDLYGLNEEEREIVINS